MRKKDKKIAEVINLLDATDSNRSPDALLDNPVMDNPVMNTPVVDNPTGWDKIGNSLLGAGEDIVDGTALYEGAGLLGDLGAFAIDAIGSKLSPSYAIGSRMDRIKEYQDGIAQSRLGLSEGVFGNVEGLDPTQLAMRNANRELYNSGDYDLQEDALKSFRINNLYRQTSKADRDAASAKREQKLSDNRLKRVQALHDKNTLSSKEVNDFTSTLSKQYESNTKDDKKIFSNYGTMKSARDLDSAIGDKTMMLSYFKMIDPSSIVSYLEEAGLAKTGGIQEQVERYYNHIAGDGRMPDKARTDIMRTASAMAGNSAKRINAYKEKQLGLGTKHGITAKDLFTDTDYTVDRVKGEAESKLSAEKYPELYNKSGELNNEALDAAIAKEQAAEAKKQASYRESRQSRYKSGRNARRR